MVGGGEVAMEVPLVELSARMMRWAVGGRQSHPLVSFPASRWGATIVRSASTVFSLVAMLVKTPVRSMWYCGAGLVAIVRLVSVHQRNQTRALFHMKREW